jgi:putative copper export protein
LIKFNILKSIYNCFSILNISLVLFLSLISIINIIEISYGQSTSFEESQTAITFYLDALIKAPLLISQALVVGVSFVNSFLFIRIMKKESIFFNNYQHTIKNLILLDILNNKLFVTVIIICGAIILSMSIILIIFQASLLSFDLGLDLWSTFIILLSSSVGNIFIIKLITSVFIIALAVLYFYVGKSFKIKILNIDQKNKQEQEQENAKKQKLKTQIYLYFCIAILILGSINIFSNSIQSHNAAVTFFPYIAISVDWIHFMMVSIWVGGLFYISLNLSRKLFIKEKASNPHHDQSSITHSQYTIDPQFYSLTILLFSIIAVISIGIIFITGLYMGVLHLQQPSSLFNSPYGNILIVKLLVVFLMAILGGYHHFRIPVLFNQKSEKIKVNQLQKLKRFNKSLKIEYILGFSIITISSFLTVTSPPQHESHNMNMMSFSPYRDSDMQKMADIDIKNQNFDKTFSLIALALSISITILMILFVKRSWTNLKLYNQINH